MTIPNPAVAPAGGTARAPLPSLYARRAVQRPTTVNPDDAAIVIGEGRDRQVLGRAQADRRIEEFAAGLVALGAPPGAGFAVPAVADGETALLAIAALEAGLHLVLDDPSVPTSAGLRLATDVGPPADPLWPLLRVLDSGRSLDRIAAHGAMHVALAPQDLARRTAARNATDPAIVTSAGPPLDFAALWAGVDRLLDLGDLLRAGEPILFARGLDAPWVVALAMAAYARGAPIAFGGAATAGATGPGVIVDGPSLARDLEAVVGDPQSGYLARLRRIRAARAERGRAPSSTADTGVRVAGALQRGADPFPSGRRARLVLLEDTDRPRAFYERTHDLGPLPLRLAADPAAAAPVLLNRPHRFRLGALGLPLPDHDVHLEDGRVVVHGPSIAGPARRARTGIAARPGPDGFLMPAEEPPGD